MFGLSWCLHNSHVQIGLLSSITFLTYGIYISITSIGNGGQETLDAASYSNFAQYLTCMLSGPFMGGVLNYLGPRRTVFMATIPFVLYTSSLLAYPYIHSAAFLIVAGTLTGLGNAGVWTPQGTFSNTYVTQNDKGKAIAFFFCVYALSGVMAGAIVFGLNSATDAKAISTATYATFVGLGVFGVFLALFLVAVTTVRLPDGSPVEVEPFDGWRTELRDLLRATVAPRILTMAPFFMASQWYSAYQFNGYNAYFYNVRSRGANLIFYRIASIVAGVVCSKIIDHTTWTVRRRGLVTWLIITILFVGSWAGALYVQFSNTPDDGQTPPHLDIAEGRYWARWLIFTVWGFLDIANNTMILWLVGCLSSQNNVVALYIGAMVSWQALGLVIAWAIDAAKVEYRVQCVISTAVGLVGLVSLLAAVVQLPNTTEYFDRAKRAPSVQTQQDLHCSPQHKADEKWQNPTNAALVNDSPAVLVTR
ncbi:hypothetical protein IWQ60_003885 [Tieghemiomyces parasiticus]|uniref:UNC93-like protein n=1 Tax=Tieghemiomyces parasiticus TaxID=78921 RepID=A0A9W8A9F4_9FUNG|nr:hypothetical protein IWQ60_003885 [Tieghemiomyces parasiticus]